MEHDGVAKVGQASEITGMEDAAGDRKWFLTVTDTPDRADYRVILDALAGCEEGIAGPLNVTPLAILIMDPDGTTLGGLWGRSLFRWLNIELLSVPESLRGQGIGKIIMQQAEDIARARGCIGIWLDTYEFQAPAFYEKLGFQPFGTLEDIPPGHRRIFMRKRWEI